MRATGGLLEFSLIGQEVSGMATHRPIKWARVAKVAGAVVAGVLAVPGSALTPPYGLAAPRDDHPDVLRGRGKGFPCTLCRPNTRLHG